MKRGTSDIDAVDRLLHRHMMAMNAVRLFSSNFVQCISLLLAQMRSADRIDLCLSLEAKRKTFTRDEYFAF